MIPIWSADLLRCLKSAEKFLNIIIYQKYLPTKIAADAVPLPGFYILNILPIIYRKVLRSI